MSFNVLFRDVTDEDLGPLLTRAAELGYATPSVSPILRRSEDQAAVAAATAEGDLVTDWELASRREGQVYRWPDTLEHYDRYDIYKGLTQREGTVFISLGWTVRHGSWGADRLYAVSFLSQQAPQTPLSEFLAADDYAETRELVAVIRGSNGGRRMYGSAAELPTAYGSFRIAVYRDRIQVKGAWNKLAVVAAEDDVATILNHSLIQARRRGDL
jgi:hypothetical protein